MEDIDVCRSSNTHNNMICLSCHGPNDLTLGYVSRDTSLIIGKLERIKLFYLYKCNRIENAIINTFLLLLCKRVLPFGRKSNYDVCKMAPKCPSIPVRLFKGVVRRRKKNSKFFKFNTAYEDI